MTKVRISVSLDAELAGRLRAHAERAGMGVSAYFLNAAIRQMAESEAAEAEAALLPPLAEPGDDDLTDGERREVGEALSLVYGPEGESRCLRGWHAP
jgi:hypothetical protein